MSVKWIQDQLRADDYSIEEMGRQIEEGDWTSGGKWESKEDVYDMTEWYPEGNDWEPSEHSFDPGYYAITWSRSGSYFTDYEYDEPYVVKVEPYTETITVTKYRKAD